jgi:antitoxin VapB
MYREDGEIDIRRSDMALQIANPSVVSKVERLARRTGLSKTAAVEQAVDRMLKDLAAPGAESARMAALLAQLDRIPDPPDATDPLPWDEHGLPA